MKKLLAAILLMSTVMAWADAFQEGFVAYSKGDYKTVLDKFTPLAVQGDARAQTMLGAMYQDGVGVVQNFNQAASWYTLAAKQGEINAQYNLGVMYYDGQGVVQDYKQAMRWYMQAAEQGDTDAQNNLGLMYSKGQGVLQDNARAHMWFNIAAANGGKNAPQNRDILAAKMTPQQIERAQQMARDCVARNHNRCN